MQTADESDGSAPRWILKVRSFVARRWIWIAVGAALLMVAVSAMLQVSLLSESDSQCRLVGNLLGTELTGSCEATAITWPKAAQVGLAAVLIAVAGTLVTAPILAGLSRLGAFLGIESIGTLSRLIARLDLPDEYRRPEDLPWRTLLSQARKVTIVGRHFFPMCFKKEDDFHEFLARSGTTLSVYLPDLETLERSGSLSLLAVPHPDPPPGYPDDTTAHFRDRLNQSIQCVRGWAARHESGKVDLHLTGNQAPSYFLVMIDDETLIYSPYEIFYENAHSWPFVRLSQKTFSEFTQAAHEDLRFFEGTSVQASAPTTVDSPDTQAASDDEEPQEAR